MVLNRLLIINLNHVYNYHPPQSNLMVLNRLLIINLKINDEEEISMREFIDKEHPIEEDYYQIMDRYTGKNARYIIPKLRKLIELDPHYFETYTSLVEMYYSLEEFEKGDILINRASEKALERIADRKGSWPDRLEWGWLENRHIIRALLNQAILDWKGEKDNEALELLRKLLRSNPRDNIGARFYILGIRMNMSFIDFELRFNKNGFYDKDMLEWFDAHYKDFPDEFGWWDEEMEKYDSQDEDFDSGEMEGDSGMELFTIDNIYEKFDLSEDLKEIFERLELKKRQSKFESFSPPETSPKPKIFQLKITLQDIKPPVWRRVLISNQATFYDLHLAIQEFFNWGNYHLHEFSFSEAKNSNMHIRLLGLDPEGNIPEDVGANFISDYEAHEDKVRLYEVFFEDRRSVRYVYDFGDNWTHNIRLEKQFPLKKGFKGPLCVGGKRAAPPEDCGGPWGYEDFLKIIANPKHPEHDDMKEWVGGRFDPNETGIKMHKMTPKQNEAEYGSISKKETVKKRQREKPNVEIKDKTFNHLFKLFLSYRSTQLKEDSLRLYEDVMGLLEAYLDRYGANYLTDEENDRFEEHAKKKPKLTFCEFFGADFLDRFGLSEFLGYFVPRKVIGGKMTFKSIPRVLRSFVKWLYKHGGIDKEVCEDHLETIKDFEEFELEEILGGR